MTTQIWAIGLVVLATIVGAFGPIFLKKATSKRMLHFKSLITNYYLFAGITLYILGTVLFIPALKGGDLSVLYPFVALNYVWTSFLSTKYLGEKMNKIKWMGIALIIIGVSFIGFGS